MPPITVKSMPALLAPLQRALVTDAESERIDGSVIVAFPLIVHPF